MSEAPDKIFNAFPGKPGFPDVPKDPFKWVTPERFSKNPMEQQISDSYIKAQAEGGLSTPKGWELLTGDKEQAQKDNKITIIMPAYREPGIGGAIDSLLHMTKPDDVPVEIIIAADGGQQETLNAAKPYEGMHGNIQVIVQAFERSGKIGVIKKVAAEKPEQNDFIVCDADCRFGQDAIGLVWAGMRRFPEVPVVSGLSLPVSNESLMHKITLPTADAASRRVSGPLVGMRQDVVDLVPDDFKWEDYFLMTWMENFGHEYICIQEANVFYLPPILQSEHARAGQRLKTGLEQIDDAISSSEGFEPTHPTLKGSKPKLALMATRGAAKAWRFIERRLKHNQISTGSSNEPGWEPNKTTKPA